MKKMTLVCIASFTTFLCLAQDFDSIETANGDSIVIRKTISDFPRNIICVDYGLAAWIDTYYERLLPVSDRIGLTFRAGHSLGTGFASGGAIHGGAGIVFGKNKHLGYFAAGLRHEYGEEEQFRDTPYTQPYFKLFYRFVAYNGLVLNVGVELIMPTIGIGYTF